jgi:hypothetical protein
LSLLASIRLQMVDMSVPRSLLFAAY